MILNLTFRTLALRQCLIHFDKGPTLKMSAVFKTLCGDQFSISSELINPVKTLPPLSSNEDHGVEQHNSETGTDGEVRKPLNNGDRRMEEMLKMLECVQILTKEVAKNEDVQEKKDEWNTVVAILDRAFRMLFLIMFFLSTLAIFYFSMV